MEQIHRVWMIGLIFMLMTAACSNPTQIADKKVETRGEKPREPAKDAEGMLEEGPGLLAGKRYSEEKAKQELKKLPNGLI